MKIRYHEWRMYRLAKQWKRISYRNGRKIRQHCLAVTILKEQA